MSSKIHILGFAGSLRQKSYNKALLKVAQEFLSEDAELEIFALDDIPLFNEDLVPDPPEPVRVFKEKISQADALLIAVTEYNYSVSGVLKNAIDWASWPIATTPLRGKLAAIMGAGGRFGTVRAQLNFRQTLLYTDTRVLLKPEIYIEKSWEKFDSESNLVDQHARQAIEALVTALVLAARAEKEKATAVINR
ncbi:MAG TPA: NAD(P)H-dependent oxidoreductase [Ktedonobacteraceae bacterium]|nr:NAD(P)H-dependent oxidoreductase [Ktedonobacteraceae bacterium]